MLNSEKTTLEKVRKNARPAEHMATVGHLGGSEVLLETDRTSKLISRTINHLFNVLPFGLAGALEAGQRL